MDLKTQIIISILSSKRSKRTPYILKKCKQEGLTKRRVVTNELHRLAKVGIVLCKKLDAPRSFTGYSFAWKLKSSMANDYMRN
jgi:hypothetical protein